MIKEELNTDASNKLVVTNTNNDGDRFFEDRYIEDTLNKN